MGFSGEWTVGNFLLAFWQSDLQNMERNQDMLLNRTGGRTVIERIYLVEGEELTHNLTCFTFQRYRNPGSCFSDGRLTV